jgi:hypothetical protein
MNNINSNDALPSPRFSSFRDSSFGLMSDDYDVGLTPIGVQARSTRGANVGLYQDIPPPISFHSNTQSLNSSIYSQAYLQHLQLNQIQSQYQTHPPSSILHYQPFQKHQQIQTSTNSSSNTTSTTSTVQLGHEDDQASELQFDSSDQTTNSNQENSDPIIAAKPSTSHSSSAHQEHKTSKDAVPVNGHSCDKNIGKIESNVKSSNANLDHTLVVASEPKVNEKGIKSSGKVIPQQVTSVITTSSESSDIILTDAKDSQKSAQHQTQPTSSTSATTSSESFYKISTPSTSAAKTEQTASGETSEKLLSTSPKPSRFIVTPVPPIEIQESEMASENKEEEEKEGKTKEEEDKSKIKEEEKESSKKSSSKKKVRKKCPEYKV